MGTYLRATNTAVIERVRPASAIGCVLSEKRNAGRAYCPCAGICTVMLGSGSADTGLQLLSTAMAIAARMAIRMSNSLVPEGYCDGGGGEDGGEVDGEPGVGVGGHQSGSSHGRVAA